MEGHRNSKTGRGGGLKPKSLRGKGEDIFLLNIVWEKQQISIEEA